MQSWVGTWISEKIHQIYTHNKNYSNWIDAYPSIGYVQLVIQEVFGGAYRAELGILNEKNEVYLLLNGKIEFATRKIFIYPQETEDAQVLELKNIRENEVKCRVFGEWVLLKKTPIIDSKI
jgi:hypothetical protein